VRLPALLRIFYQAWGRRKDMTQTNQSMLGPAELPRRPDALIFCAENQGTCYWAIEDKALEQVNPPVVIADALRSWKMSEISSPLVWTPSHPHVSDFLDTLAYQHAFWGGAMHGGSGHFHSQKFHTIWLEQHWHQIMVKPMALGLADGNDTGLPSHISLYVRNGLVLDWFQSGCSLAACSVKDLDEIGQVLQITWKHRW
jgi:hypothetical protein